MNVKKTKSEESTTKTRGLGGGITWIDYPHDSLGRTKYSSIMYLQMIKAYIADFDNIIRLRMLLERP